VDVRQVRQLGSDETQRNVGRVAAEVLAHKHNARGARQIDPGPKHVRKSQMPAYMCGTHNASIHVFTALRKAY
jgi:hypothetical protein